MDNNYMFNFDVFDSIDDPVIFLGNKNQIINLNESAKKWGFLKDKALLSFITFEEIDQLAEYILKNKDLEIESNIYFFKGFSKYCKVNYKSENHLLIFQDKTETELLKKVKEDFVTSLSHELRTPLTIAKGNVHILKDFLNSQKFSKQIFKIEESLDKIENILTQLTLLSKAEFGDYKIKKEIIDPFILYKEVKEDLSEKTKEKNINLVFNCEIKNLKADRFVLYTILRNLLSNAIKYSFENSSVIIEILPNKILVKDEGIGIREEEKSRIFERFYRGIEADKHAKGSGLGLAVVKYLCELAGYEIHFDSIWMVGTTFEVYFSNN